jgi:hypothetical protein
MQNHAMLLPPVVQEFVAKDHLARFVLNLMRDDVQTNFGRKREQLSADADYCSEANLEALETRGIDAYVATGRARDAVAGHVEGEAAAAPQCRSR